MFQCPQDLLSKPYPQVILVDFASFGQSRLNIDHSSSNLVTCGFENFLTTYTCTYIRDLKNIIITDIWALAQSS